MAFSQDSFVYCRQVKLNTIKQRSFESLSRLDLDPRWGRTVSSIDFETNKPVIDRVIGVHYRMFPDTYLLTLRNGAVIQTTAEQRLLTRNGIKFVKELSAGESVAGIKTKKIWYSQIDSIEKFNKTLPMFYLKLSHYHNYIVNGIVVYE